MSKVGPAYKANGFVHGGLQPANQLGGRTLQWRAQRRCNASGQSSVESSVVVNSRVEFARQSTCSEVVTFVAVATAVAGAPMLSIMSMSLCVA